jgi:hypothetical protein
MPRTTGWLANQFVPARHAAHRGTRTILLRGRLVLAGAQPSPRRERSDGCKMKRPTMVEETRAGSGTNRSHNSQSSPRVDASTRRRVQWGLTMPLAIPRLWIAALPWQGSIASSPHQPLAGGSAGPAVCCLLSAVSRISLTDSCPRGETSSIDPRKWRRRSGVRGGKGLVFPKPALLSLICRKTPSWLRGRLLPTLEPARWSI